MNKGFFMIDRAIFDDAFMDDKPFCRRGFVSYLYEIATYKPRFMDFNGTDVWVEKGDVAISLRQFETVTGWTPPKTQRFLKRLANRNIIRIKTVTPVTIINLCFLSDYTTPSNNERYTNVTATATGALQARYSDVTATATQPNKDNNVIKKKGSKNLCRAKTLDALSVFEHWQKVMNKPDAKFIGKRKRKVEMRLAEKYSVEDLKRAIDGCAGCRHNQGDNENGKVYNDLELICRDPVKVEQFMGYTKPNEPIPSKQVFYTDESHESSGMDKSRY